MRTTLIRVVNSGQAASSVLVLVGPRGLGKTVMLDVIADAAAERNLLTVQVALDAVSDGPQLLAGRLATVAERMSHSAGRSAWRLVQRRLAQLSVEVDLGVVTFTSPPAARGDAARTASAREHLAELLVAVAELARQDGRAGLVILLDELQQAREHDLIVITNALQDALRIATAPFATFAAGLPNTPDLVAAASSFTERFEFRTLQRLSTEEAERALLEPALGAGVTWEPRAVELVVTAAGGSPHLVQLFGDEVWVTADPEREETITVVQTAAALEEAQGRLHDGMFRSRWARVTGAERELLVALARTADTSGESESRNYAAVLGRTTQQTSPVRQSLLDKGLVESSGRGRLRFTIPGFDKYVLAQLDDRTG